jgi:hypothetical protein
MGKKKKNRQQKQQQPVNNNPQNIRAPAGAPVQSGQELEEKDKGGAPCKYPTHIYPRLEEIAYWGLLGLTNAEMCDANHLDIAESTFYLYLNKFSEFSEAVNRNKPLSNAEVVIAQHKKAVGYDYDEKTYERALKRNAYGEVMLNEKGYPEYEMIEVKSVTKHVTASDKAGQWWLHNRDRKNFPIGAGGSGTNIHIDNKQSQGQLQGQQQAQSQSLKHLSKEELKSKILKLYDIRRTTE